MDQTAQSVAVASATVCPPARCALVDLLFSRTVVIDIREVVVAIATRMAYLRVCLTTGSKRESARIIGGPTAECGG